MKKNREDECKIGWAEKEVRTSAAPRYRCPDGRNLPKTRLQGGSPHSEFGEIFPLFLTDTKSDMRIGKVGGNIDKMAVVGCINWPHIYNNICLDLKTWHAAMKMNVGG